MQKKYKCRPIEIEAYKLENNEQSIIDAVKFILNNKDEMELDYCRALLEMTFSIEGLIISNEKVEIKAFFGDYIIKEGSIFRVCKPGLFDVYYQEL